MHHPYRLPLGLICLAAGCATLLFMLQGQAKVVALWQWTDIIGEGGMALMSAGWMLMILGSRPRGRVTTLLASGLAGIALGSWVDCMDEFWKLDHAVLWDNWLEAGLTLGGMLTLTVGLYCWREEQFVLNEQLLKRERLFREHRAFDRITQLANAEYLRRQIRLEQARQAEVPCGLILLDIDRFHAINREHGAAEGDRVLQALSHLLLLNLRNDDLLCRYAGDRFAILLPETQLPDTEQMARQLREAVATLAHHSRAHGQRLQLSARVACAVADRDADILLQVLNAALEPAAAALPAMQTI
ncbi:GGDEF domain-containing protein [Chitinimonas naiadis]